MQARCKTEYKQTLKYQAWKDTIWFMFYSFHILLAALFHCFPPPFVLVDSFLHMSDGCYATSTRMLLLKIKKSIYLTLKIIHCYIFKTSNYTSLVILSFEIVVQSIYSIICWHQMWNVMKHFWFFCRYYNILVLIACFIMPTLIPVYLWNETIKNAWFTAVMLRWTATSNTIWSVNSFAHKYGNHPYDR